MAGVFKFHPKTASSALTCNLGDLSGNPYYIVIPVDWKESEREQVVSGVNDDFFPPADYENVEVEITVAIGGSTEAETYQNFLTFDTELRRYKGGVIEYKPVEFPSGIRSTFYHYEFISAPRRIQGALSVPSSEYQIATGYAYTVWIRPWATSDPYNLTEVVSSETVSNAGSYILSNSLITSPIMFPRIKLDEVTGGGEPDFTKVYMHIRPHTVGNGNTNDLAPQQQNGPSGWTSGIVDARAIGGSVSRSPSGSTVYWSQLFDPGVLLTIDWSWFGYGTPIISCLPTSSSAVWNIRPYVSERGHRDIVVYGDWTEITGTYRGPYFFQDLPIPPGGGVPSYINQATTPDIDAYMAGSNNLRFGFEFQRISGSGSIDVDFIGFLNGNNSWQAKIFNVDESTISGGYEVWIDPFGGTIHEVWPETPFYQMGWSKVGDPIKSLVLRRGYDYVFSFLIETDSDGFHADAGVILSVDALYGTIHPFST